MRILVTNTDIDENVIASTVLNGMLASKYTDSHIDWIVKNEYIAKLIRSDKNTSSVYVLPEMPNNIYDLYISLSDDLVDVNRKIISHERLILNNESDEYKVLYGNRQTKQNIFQVYSGIADLSWRGEGFNFSYTSKNRSLRKTGIYIENSNLRNYVLGNCDKYDLNNSWTIPYRKNYFKQIDEMSYCSRIITDSFSVLYLSLWMRKPVEFLSISDINFKIETFGIVNIHNIHSRYAR